MTILLNPGPKRTKHCLPLSTMIGTQRSSLMLPWTVGWENCAIELNYSICVKLVNLSNGASPLPQKSLTCIYANKQTIQRGGFWKCNLFWSSSSLGVIINIIRLWWSKTIWHHSPLPLRKGEKDRQIWWTYAGCWRMRGLLWINLNIRRCRQNNNNDDLYSSLTIVESLLVLLMMVFFAFVLLCFVLFFFCFTLFYK